MRTGALLGLDGEDPDGWVAGPASVLHVRGSRRSVGGGGATSRWVAAELLRAGCRQQQVTRLLESCDRRTAVGRRDYAIVLLLSRLGLRCGEVAGLDLEDVDWRASELVVPRQGLSRLDRLPLSSDVGEALADYLRYGRPRGFGERCSCTRTRR